MKSVEASLFVPSHQLPHAEKAAKKAEQDALQEVPQHLCQSSPIWHAGSANFQTPMFHNQQVRNQESVLWEM